MKKLCLSMTLMTLLLMSKGYCWNALGHRLVAQIAYNHLTTHAKQVCNQYNHALDSRYRPQSLVNAAVWLDQLRNPNELWMLAKHYIDIPFSQDNTKLMPPDKINAVSAIEEARAILQNHLATDFDKGFNLRILLHVVGDLHQPMHAVSQFSAAHPDGDKGGNLVYLKANTIASNLHAYWDKGGGYLSARSYSSSQLNRKAHSIEKRWPCKDAKINFDPKAWAQESYQLAVSKAYQLKTGQKPDKKYQQMAKKLTEQRIALAGCRLAAMLNELIF